MTENLKDDSHQSSSAAAAAETAGDDSSLRLAGAKEIPRTNVSLPDIEDTSMNKVFTYLEFYEQDLTWSFFSDSFFIVGGILYLILSVWECQNQSQSYTTTIYYFLLNAIAPLAYVLNSIIDIQWAYHAKLRHKKKAEMKHQWMLEAYQQKQPGCFASLQDVQDAAMSTLQQLRKHAAHRRTILAAFTFGLAALFGFLAVLVPNEHACIVLDFLSAHTYIISAVVATSGQRTRPWFATSHCDIWYNPEILEDIGDALFLVGSLVDATLVDFDLEQPQLSILSSFLWLIDACFYLRSDFVMANQMQDRKDLDNAFVFV